MSSNGTTQPFGLALLVLVRCLGSRLALPVLARERKAAIQLAVFRVGFRSEREKNKTRKASIPGKI